MVVVTSIFKSTKNEIIAAAKAQIAHRSPKSTSDTGDLQ